MPQLLHLQNGESVLSKIRSGTGRLAQLLRSTKSEAERVDELFLATLGRLPTAEVRSRFTVLLNEAGKDGKDEAYRDLFWALLNSKEFSFNH